MKLRPSTPVYTKRTRRCRESAFTIIEFIVASFLGLLTVGLALAGTLAHRATYFDDTVRTRITQNLRSAMDIMGLNVRQAGEALDASFPAVLVTDGPSGAPDELRVRRNRFENEILKVCQSLPGGTISSEVLVGETPNGNPNCVYDALLVPYLNTWGTYITGQGGIARGFAFNRTSRLGEFFPITGIYDSGSVMRVSRQTGAWSNSYSGDGASAEMYLLEEYHYRVSNGVLQLIIDEDTSNILNVVDGITDFQIRVHTGTGPMDTFAVNDDWTGIQSLEVTLRGQEVVAGKLMESSLTTRLFPRNVLSQ